ncbi:hypothetical protein SISSUDRAFT_1119257 [Sistotremastrum suecicum HHB10207 ss-3]|uniref:F-box domain-containing protein n=1 Tax=Sistotremastrum suecicum HHB10207 ss-3 TaxID=1314776 RepID=A0A166DYA6_9AGAM|nr:hypothetical protein SISSUDRAFT_1119257 [Sistotremastrum suecicum HHB10207 ss-3]
MEPCDVNERLSEDVLRMIMWQYVFTENLQSLDPYTAIYNNRLPLEAIVVSSVCKKWRQVAFDYPAIWSQIHFAWPRDTISMYMALRRQMPLSIAINESAWQSNYFQEFQETLVASMSTVERMSVTWGGGLLPPPTALTSFVSRLLNQKVAAPKLWYLHLLFRGTLQPDISIEFPEISVIRTLDVSLKSFRFNWHTLKRVVAETSDLKLSEIIEFLGAARRLENIVLYHKGWNYSGDDDDSEVAEIKSPRSPATLPNLRVFALEWCGRKFADQLVQTIRSPTSSTIALSIVRQENVSMWKSLPDFLLKILRSAHTLALEIIGHKLTVAPPFALIFQAANSPRYRIYFDEVPNMRMRSPSARAELCYSQFDDLLRDLSSMSFDNLVNVAIHSRRVPNVVLLQQFSQAFRDVENLCVQGYSVDHVIEALQSSNNPASGHYPFPKLRSLDLRGSRFDHDQLNAMLMNRKGWATDLEELNLTLDPKQEARVDSKLAQSRKITLRKVSRSVSTYQAEEGDVTDSSDDGNWGWEE